MEEAKKSNMGTGAKEGRGRLLREQRKLGHKGDEDKKIYILMVAKDLTEGIGASLLEHLTTQLNIVFSGTCKFPKLGFGLNA